MQELNNITTTTEIILIVEEHFELRTVKPNC